MLLSNEMKWRDFQILATDIDINALDRAKKGVYLERALNEVPIAQKDKYFEKDGAMFKIKEEVKRNVTFKKQNLLSDSFGGPFDLIVCRNVLIYFTEDAKDLLYHKFSQALRPGGIFFVGSTEQIFTPAKYGFETADTFFIGKYKLMAKQHGKNYCCFAIVYMIAIFLMDRIITW